MRDALYPPAGVPCCYRLVAARSSSYKGSTNDLWRRLRQHNGELAGGARSTRGRGPWRPRCVVTGFPTLRDARRFEWAFKHSRARTEAFRAQWALATTYYSRKVLCPAQQRCELSFRAPPSTAGPGGATARTRTT